MSAEEYRSVRGHIFNIQRFCTHDGPGIRTTVFLKGCPLRCFWCQNPESVSLSPMLMHNRELCVGCGRCVAACLCGSAAIIGDSITFDRTKCTACGMCVELCSMDALSLAGYEVSVDEVLQEIVKDRVHYINSNGGVTLSGGEPAMQPEFATALLITCKAEGLHTVVETCGNAPWKIFESFLSHVNVFYWDIKKIDTTGHKSGTGVDNALILENAERMAQTGVEMRFRMPLIPGFNDTEDDVCSLIKFVTERCGRTRAEIDLLRYNNYGESKFNSLGRDGPHLISQSEEDLERLNALLVV